MLLSNERDERDERDGLHAEGYKVTGRGFEKYEMALCNVYKDIFDFFGGVASIFMKSNRSKYLQLTDHIPLPLINPEPRTRPQIVGNLVWKPFDLRFADILKVSTVMPR
jgi:hypothetical protein